MKLIKDKVTRAREEYNKTMVSHKDIIEPVFGPIEFIRDNDSFLALMKKEGIDWQVMLPERIVRDQIELSEELTKRCRKWNNANGTSIESNCEFLGLIDAEQVPELTEAREDWNKEYCCNYKNNKQFLDAILKA